MRVAGFQKIDSETKKAYIELFNSNAIFLMDPKDRQIKMEKDARIINDLTETATLILYKGEYISEEDEFDGEACFEAILSAVRTYDASRKNDEGNVATPFQYFVFLYNNKRKTSFIEDNTVKISSTIIKLGKNIKRIINEEYSGNMEFINDVIDEMKLDSSHREETWDAAKKYAQNMLYAFSLDAPTGDEEESTLGEVLEDTRSDVESQVIKDTGEELLDKIITMADVFTTAKDEELYRVIVTNRMLRELKLDEDKHAFDDYPAGDEKFYLICARREKELLNRLFIKGYVKQEINDSPESLGGLYGIYFNYLKGKLNNKAMASFLGKPESSFAQTQKRMDGLIRKGLL